MSTFTFPACDAQWKYQPSQPFTPARIHDGVTCQHCGCTANTEAWSGEGGALAAVHGLTQQWCLHCILKAQIAYAERIAATLPELRKNLASLDMSSITFNHPQPEDLGVNRRSFFWTLASLCALPRLARIAPTPKPVARVFDPETGLSMRLVQQWAPPRESRFDVLYGWPEHASVPVSVDEA